MSDAGIKISKPFYDATTAADFNLLFNSEWPSLPIAFETTITVPSSALVTITHNLGFVPLAMIWRTTAGVTTRTFPTFSQFVNSNTIKVGGSAGDRLHVKLYNVDISVDVDYPFTTNASLASAYDNDYGIKIAKQDKNIDSGDLRDFVLHSRCQSPQILAVKTQATADGTTVKYISPSNYAAWVFGFIRKATGDYYFAPYFSQAYPRTFVTQSGSSYNYSLQYAGTDVGASIVVLRDPFFASTDIQVSY